MMLLVSHCRSLYDIKSWATAFHALVLGWLVLRGMFWMLTIYSMQHWRSSTFYILYWLPNPLQFGCFLLLPLFYSQVLSSRRGWRRLWAFIRPSYISLISGMTTFMIASSILMATEGQRGQQQYKCVSARPTSHGHGKAHHHHCYRMDFSSDAFRLLSALCFFALSIFVAAFGVQVAKLEAWQHRRFLIYQPRALAVVNCILFAVFLSKGGYQVVSVMRLWHLPDIPLQGDEDVCLLNFLVFLYWDYLPTLSLLLVVTGRSRGNSPATDAKNKGALNPQNPADGLQSMLGIGAGSEKDSVKPPGGVKAKLLGDRRNLDNLPNYGLFTHIKNNPKLHFKAKGDAGYTMAYPGSASAPSRPKSPFLLGNSMAQGLEDGLGLGTGIEYSQRSERGCSLTNPASGTYHCQVVHPGHHCTCGSSMNPHHSMPGTSYGEHYGQHGEPSYGQLHRHPDFWTGPNRVGSGWMRGQRMAPGPGAGPEEGHFLREDSEGVGVGFSEYSISKYMGGVVEGDGVDGEAAFREPMTSIESHISQGKRNQEGERTKTTGRPRETERTERAAGPSRMWTGFTEWAPVEGEGGHHQWRVYGVGERAEDPNSAYPSGVGARGASFTTPGWGEGGCGRCWHGGPVGYHVGGGGGRVANIGQVDSIHTGRSGLPIGPLPGPLPVPSPSTSPGNKGTWYGQGGPVSSNSPDPPLVKGEGKVEVGGNPNVGLGDKMSSGKLEDNEPPLASISRPAERNVKTAQRVHDGDKYHVQHLKEGDQTETHAQPPLHAPKSEPVTLGSDAAAGHDPLRSPQKEAALVQDHKDNQKDRQDKYGVPSGSGEREERIRGLTNHRIMDRGVRMNNQKATDTIGRGG
ncbi:unnamed protein product, partial [Discosporangium mesarthrocarpum]